MCYVGTDRAFRGCIRACTAESSCCLCADKISTNTQAKTLKIRLLWQIAHADAIFHPPPRPFRSLSAVSSRHLVAFLDRFFFALPLNMSYEDRANARPNLNDESDNEEEAMVNDYREQVNFDDGMSDLDRTLSQGATQAQDLQAQLAAAATPLEYQATLETKFASYDNYCSLFHYILNSDGPVDLEVPSVRDSIHQRNIE